MLYLTPAHVGTRLLVLSGTVRSTLPWSCTSQHHHHVRSNVEFRGGSQVGTRLLRDVVEIVSGTQGLPHLSRPLWPSSGYSSDGFDFSTDV